AAVGDYPAIEITGSERSGEGDQALGGSCLGPCEGVRIIRFFEPVEGGSPDATFLEEIQGEGVDCEEGVPWLLDRGEEADALRLELAGLQRQNGAVKSIVGPVIVLSHADVVTEKVHLSPSRPSARSRRKPNGRSGPSSQCGPYRHI